MQNLQSAELVTQCKKGNRKAQHLLYHQHVTAMYSISVRIVGDTAEAEDITQRAFIQAFNKLPHLKDNQTFSAWLKTIVVNFSIDKLRQRKVKFISLDEEIQAELTAPPVEDIEYGADTIHCIRQGILLLPEGYRTIFSLYLIEGYDHSEISEILGISESTSRSQYARAKLKLRKILSTHFKIQV